MTQYWLLESRIQIINYGTELSQKLFKEYYRPKCINRGSTLFNNAEKGYLEKIDFEETNHLRD